MKYLFIFLVILLTVSCTHQKEVDLKTGIVTIGKGLSCKNVFLFDGKNEVESKKFTYGEQVFVTFDDIQGFVRDESGYMFPGMSLCIVSVEGDTVMKNNDAYIEYTDGINNDPLTLQSKLTFAKPMESGKSYTLYIGIWDKQNKRLTFNFEFFFSVESNKNITVKSNHVSYNEVYLYSTQRSKVITNNDIHLNEPIYVVIEGLKGFQENDSMVVSGLQMLLKTAQGDTIQYTNDLFLNKQMAASKFSTQLAPQIILTDAEEASVIFCDLFLWDKLSPASLKATIKLSLL